MIYGQLNPKIDKMIATWQPFLQEHADWKRLITGITPKQNGCGTIYELPNYLHTPNESAALVDMRALAYVQPHYHAFGMWEIQYVLDGSAEVIIGQETYQVHKGDFIIIPPEVAYYAFPDANHILFCLNTPAFHPESYIVLEGDNHDHHFSQAAFEEALLKHQK